MNRPWLVTTHGPPFPIMYTGDDRNGEGPHPQQGGAGQNAGDPQRYEKRHRVLTLGTSDRIRMILKIGSSVLKRQ